jgi:hypothetical protein
MDELHRGGQLVRVLHRTAAKPCCGSGEQGPQPFAAGGNQVLRQGRDQGHRAIHTVAHQGVHRRHVVDSEGDQVLDRHLLASGGSFQDVQINLVARPLAPAVRRQTGGTPHLPGTMVARLGRVKPSP